MTQILHVKFQLEPDTEVELQFKPPNITGYIAACMLEADLHRGAPSVGHVEVVSLMSGGYMLLTPDDEPIVASVLSRMPLRLPASPALYARLKLRLSRGGMRVEAGRAYLVIHEEAPPAEYVLGLVRKS